MTFVQLAGVLPAIIFPAATAFQLYRLFRARSAVGVSVSTWVMFGVANIALFIYTERYTEWQSILGLLGTALLDFVIAAVALIEIQRAKAAKAAAETQVPW